VSLRRVLPPALAAVVLSGCASHHQKVNGTIGDLRHVRPDLQETKVDQGLDQAMLAYRKFLESTPQTAMTPEAMRRLADLQIEKQFGIHNGDGKPRGMDAPKPLEAPLLAERPATAPAGAAASADAAGAGSRESDRDFEQRTTTAASGMPADGGAAGPSQAGLPAGADPKGPLEAVALYEKLLKDYPSYENSDQVLYQMARAYDEIGRTEEAMAIMERLIRANPHSVHADEVQFRRGEFFFTRRKFRDAENAYTAIVGEGTASPFYELAVYKLGWTFYKQDLYDEALQQYMALIDYKVSVGYDFDARHDEDDERRVADTFRVVSLSFSNLGGPDAVRDYFSRFGSRPYEDRVYANLGEHYLAKLRYDDAAKTYNAFVALYPFHKSAPGFSMKVIDTFTQGGFPKLVLESKRDFASRYGVHAEYWKHIRQEDAPDVLAYLKTNLKDLATHYHARYQDAKADDEKLANYHEAGRWYGEYLDSFPADPEAPAMNYQLAGLHLENKDFDEAAKQYERTAYGYPAHEKSADAGYAAVYAYREELKVADKEQKDTVRKETVASSLKFADTFPGHEKAAPILGAAADDLYEMKEYGNAVTTAQRVIGNYPAAEPALRRAAWIVVAHGSFELVQYPQAEQAYTEVLAATPDGDASRAGFVDNLAASIYKQGEQARDAQDYRAAANHFLRIRTAAPTSTIRPAAEYDAGAALMTLQDWPAAAEALEGFRKDFPDHKLVHEATRQIALAYRQGGQLSRAAGEYERLASETDDPSVRGESLLAAGDLYGQSKDQGHALAAYTHYVEAFPKPVETALETRFKIADIHKATHEDVLYQKELKTIVRLDADAGKERTARTRTLAGRSALVLAEPTYETFAAVKLRQPFEKSLQEKKQQMDATIDAMGRLVDYEISDVTAAATYYMAETYFNFSQSLKDSERPTDLPEARKAEYEEALDDEAYPFEEKAIGVHEKNVELMRTGVFNEWTEKSLAKLAEMVPGRYARKETSIGPLQSMDAYVYRTPLSQQVPAPAPVPAPAGTGTATPANGTATPLDGAATPPDGATSPAGPADPGAPAETPKPPTSKGKPSNGKP
jgi:tetratricopeptide (TPR) repeat protein